jgi:hypothetical protein
MHWIDPDFLPDIKSRLERFIVNPHGEIDVLILTYDGDKALLVHVPPHLDREIEAAIRPGDELRVAAIVWATLPLMGWSGRAPALPVVQAGEGHRRQRSTPCPRNSVAKSPSSASISARTRSIWSARIAAELWCCGKSGRVAKWKPGSPTCRRRQGAAVLKRLTSLPSDLPESRVKRNHFSSCRRR